MVTNFPLFAQHSLAITARLRVTCSMTSGAMCIDRTPTMTAFAHRDIMRENAFMGVLVAANRTSLSHIGASWPSLDGLF